VRHTNRVDSLLTRTPYNAQIQKELVRLAKLGSKEAQDELVVSNMRFVRLVANRYYSDESFTMEEMIAEGVSGLIEAIDRFDPLSPNTFMSYAVFWIRQAISKYHRDNRRFIRQPANKQQDLGIRVCNIDAPLNEDGDYTIADTIEQSTFESPEDVLYRERVKVQIDEMLSCIPHDESQVIRYRYGLTGEILSYDEISSKMNMKTARLKALSERAVRRLRKNIQESPNRNDLLQYLQMTT